MRRLIEAKGEAFKQDYYSKLLPQYADEVEKSLSVSWRDLNVDETTNSLVILAKMLYPKDTTPMAMQKIGYTMAKDSMPRFYQIFIRIPSIKFVYNRVAKIWKSFNDTGEMVVDNFQDTQFTLALKGFPEYPIFLRDYQCGYILGICELLGMKNTTVKKIEIDPNAWKWEVHWDK